jgi:DNA adenine methylase
MNENAVLKTKPFIKWLGGKGKLVPQLLQKMEDASGVYHEPFLGGGALFWALAPIYAVLSDSNEHLINAYTTVRDNVEALIAELAPYPHDYAFFRQMRATFGKGSPVQRAAGFIYLNKTCFNGLFRVNKSGEFNVPFGKYENPTICNTEVLRACSKALRGIDVMHEDFTNVLHRAVKGDFVYFDPPYLPLSVTSSFTAYTPNGFSLEDHIRLRDTAITLANRGVRVVVSNSAAPAIHDLYAEHFDIDVVLAKRSINADAEGRGPIKEFIITSRSPSEEAP